MALLRNRLKRVDIYSPDEADGYIGKRPAPRLLGYVYADVAPTDTLMKSENGGVGIYRTAKLVLNGSAGVSCGDYADIDGSGPNYRITELVRHGGTVTAKAEMI